METQTRQLSLSQLAPLYGLSRSRLSQMAQLGVNFEDPDEVLRHVSRSTMRTTLVENLSRDRHRLYLQKQIQYLKQTEI